MGTECCSSDQSWEDNDIQSVGTHRQTSCLFWGQNDLEETIHNTFALAAQGHVTSCIKYKELDFVDVLEPVSFTLEGDLYFKDRLAAGGNPCRTAYLNFSYPRLIVDRPLVSRFGVILQTA